MLHDEKGSALNHDLFASLKNTQAVFCLLTDVFFFGNFYGNIIRRELQRGLIHLFFIDYSLLARRLPI